MGEGSRGSLGVTAIAALWGAAILAILISCRRDFDSPYMPGSPGYAGDEWTRDADGNGVADSLDKYSPACGASPKTCLDNAKVISRISSQRNTLTARDILLWVGDSPQEPNLEWIPSEGALRGYALFSSDSSKVKVRGGLLLPVSPGSAQISVTVPGADSLVASFIAKVVSGGIRLESVSAKDISVKVGRDAMADVAWSPANADFRDYSLISDQPLVARIVDGQTIRGVYPGKANITLVTMDGSRKTAFSATVSNGPQVVYASVLTAETMYLVKGGNPETPVLHWSPANVTDMIYKLVPVESRFVTVTADSQQVVPLQAGSTMVLAKALDGSGKATEFTVVVAAEAMSVAGILAADMNLIQGADAVPPLLTWIPQDATNRKYSLVSSDQGVAIVSSGKVMPISMGTSVFTVTTEEGEFKADFTVTVGRPDTAVHVDSVRVADFSMPIGSPRKPVVSWYPADAGNQTFTLSSDDPAIVNPVGEQLSALKVGAANVRLTTVDGQRTADFKVTVYSPVIPVTLIGADSMSLTVGQQKPPIVSWMPSGATNPDYSLFSQDTNIVTILEATHECPRCVFARSVGSARVTVKSADGPTGTFQVVVNATTVKLVSLTGTAFTMNIGDAPRDAIVGFVPSNASNKDVTLNAPGSLVISITSQNKVEAKLPGKAALTIVSNENPNIATVCTVTVVALVKNLTAKNDTLRLGQADRNASTLLTWDPPNATDQRFALATPDTNVVKPSGMTYKAVGGGTATVTASALDGSGKSATFTVLVKVPVTALTAKDVTLKVGAPIYNSTPLISFLPATASDKTWQVSYANPAASPAPSTIVRIQSGWQFEALAPGTARIIAVSNDNPAAKDTFTVTVVQPVTGITASGFSMKMGEPDRDPIVTVQPANATDKGYTIAANTPSVATFVNNKVRAVAAGSATFTAASVNDPLKTAQFTVTVTVGVLSVTASDLAMKVGEADREPALAWNPANATNKGFTLASSNSAVVSILANKLHAVAAGAANVTVTPADGGKADTLLVTVTQPVIGITVPDITLEKHDPDKEPIIAWNPSNASNKGYTLSGGLAGVATVMANKIHAAGAGEATMTVTTADGAKVATFTVTVIVPVDGIQGKNLNMSISDNDIAPNITFTPPDATNKGFTLASQDTDVVTIVNGKIHAVGLGIASVTVTSAENGAIKDAFTVNVTLFSGPAPPP
jgi:uncharacterized protein YjdB